MSRQDRNTFDATSQRRLPIETRKNPRGRPKSRFKESQAGTLQSLDRALNVLTAVARLERTTLSDLARLMDIPTATAHRILMTLRAHSFVAFDEDRQEWMIGIEAYRTGAAFLKRNSIIEIGRPIMRKLMQDTGETANLAVPDGTEVVFVAQVETPHPIRAFFPLGTRTSMHASGTGKAILAELATPELDKALAAMDLTAFTANTIVTRDSLLENLRATRDRGWSHDREERHAGMSCIGASIHDEQGQPCAGISVSGPTFRFDARHIAELGTLVSVAAREITRLSGGHAAAAPVD